MFNEKNKAIRLLREGIPDNHNVRTAILFLSKYYKYLGYNEEDGINKIREWLGSQSLNDTNMTYSMTIDKLEDYVEDAVTKIPKNIFNRNYKFIDDVNINVSLSEMEYINTLKSKGDKLTAFGLLYVSKIFKNDTGSFYCRHNLLCKLTGMSNRQTKHIITRLEDNFMTVKRDKKGYASIKKHNGVGKRYSKPNVYNILIPEGDDIILTIPDEDNILKYFVEALYICMTEHDFKLTVRLKEFVLKKKEEFRITQTKNYG